VELKRVCVVLTTRGNYAKFKKLLMLIEKEPSLYLQTVVGGELLLQDRVTSLFDVDATSKVYFNVGGDNLVAMGKSVGMAVIEFSNAFNSLRPDMVMLVGDRFETYAAASAAYLSQIPIVHLEGGEKSGGLDDGLRYAISHLSSIHFPCTLGSGAYLQHLGFPKVHVVGSTSIDVLADIPPMEPMDIINLQKRFGVGPIIPPEAPFLLVIFHPDTTPSVDVSRSTSELAEAIDGLGMPTFWLNANLDAGTNKVGSVLRRYRDQGKLKTVHFLKSLPIEYFGDLLKNAACIVGNSSAGIREASFLGTPNLSVGSRQMGRECSGNTVFAMEDRDDIKRLVMDQLQEGRYNPDFLYGDGTASEKILEEISK
jgi:UDP-hydrolysing UDP-N-acetyl-D-glucosamine 2-epimerase